MNTCKTCKWWDRNLCCSNPKLHDSDHCHADEHKPDTAYAEADLTGVVISHAYLHTGPDFGCIHHAVGEQT